MMITLFDNDQILAAFAKEKYEDGHTEGLKEGHIETAKKMLNKSMPADLIAEVCGLTVNEVNSLKEEG